MVRRQRRGAADDAARADNDDTDGGSARRGGGGGGGTSNQRRAWADVARSRAAHFARADADDRMEGRRRSGSKRGAAAAGLQHPNEVTAKISVPMPGMRARRSSSNAEGGGDDDDAEEKHQWHGPWTVARELSEGKEAAAEARQRALEDDGGGDGGEGEDFRVDWAPRVRAKGARRETVAAAVPALQDLCLRTLVDYADDMAAGLGDVPSDVRAKFALALCDRGLLGGATLGIIIEPSASEIVIPNAAPLDEADVVARLSDLADGAVDTVALRNAGRCVSDAELPGLLRRKFKKSLRHLALDGCYRLSDAGSAALLGDFECLESLSLRYNHRLGPKTCAALRAAPSASTLRSLSLSHCPLVTPTELQAIVGTLPKLEELEIAGSEALGDDCLTALLEARGAQLLALDVSQCAALTGASVRRLRDLAPGLRRLRLNACYGLEDADVRHLFQEVSAEDAVERAAAAAGKRRRSIVSSRGSGGVTRKVSTPGGPLVQIEELQMKEVDVLDPTCEALASAAGHGLRALCLDSCDAVTDRGLVALARAGHVALRDLNVSFCRRITDAGCGYVADHCVGLKRLRVYGCTQITERFLLGHRNLALRVEGSYSASLSAPAPLKSG